MTLYEILVPTIYGDTNKPISTRHHKEWDKVVRKLAGGLTLLQPLKGQWVFETTLYEERVIPVRIMCDANTIVGIAQFAKLHYRQKAIMFYKLSDECFVI